MTAAKTLLTPQNSTLLLIDHQPQMLFGVQSHDRLLIVNNVVGLAKAAKAFDVPIILTTVGAKTFAGPLIPELQAVFPDVAPLDRTAINAWEDESVVAAVKKAGRKKLVIAGLWTEICVAYPALSARDDGYEVYAVADASGGVTLEAHELGMQRMIQAGIAPTTWLQVMCEWQRDWARTKTADQVREISQQHGGAFGQGIYYAKEMFAGRKEGAGAAEPTRRIA